MNPKVPTESRRKRNPLFLFLESLKNGNSFTVTFRNPSVPICPNIAEIDISKFSIDANKMNALCNLDGINKSVSNVDLMAGCGEWLINSTRYESEKYYPKIRTLGVELVEERAKILCPYKVGDTLIFSGRRRDKRIRVTHILGTPFIPYYAYRIKGVVIRKDGSDGRTITKDLAKENKWVLEVK